MDAAEEWGSDMSDDFDDDSDLFGAYEDIDDDYELYFDYGNEFGYGHEDDDDEDDGYD
jgi:hypothetical protein